MSEDAQDKSGIVASIGNYFMRWYRIPRILLAIWTTLLISAALALPVINWQATNNDQSVSYIYILGFVGLIIYAICWWALVGLRGVEDASEPGGTKAGVMILLGWASFIIVIAELIYFTEAFYNS